jgi:hypothetical protein
MMKTRIGKFAAVLFAAALMAGAPAVPRDEAAWQEARNRLAQAIGSRKNSPRAYVEAILGLGEATYPKRDLEAAQILVKLLVDELQDDTHDGRKEKNIDGMVLDACEVALRKVTSKPAVDYLVGALKSKSINIRARFILCRVLGAQKGDTFNVLVEILDDKDARLQIGAVDGIREQLKAELQKKVDALVLEVASGGDQASQILAAAGKALEEQPAALFKIRCDSLAFNMDSFLMGWTGNEELLKATQEMRAIAEGIAGEEPKKKVVPLVASVSEFVDKFIKSVDELNALRKNVEPAMIVLLKLLKDPKRPWEVRIGALQALSTDRHANQAESLIESLQVSSLADGRLKVELMGALASILGVKDPKTDDPNWWKGALAERKTGRLPGTTGGTTITPTEFFGLKTKSTRIVFILDKTGSMDFKCTESVLPPKKDGPTPRKGPDVPTADEKLPPQEEAMKRKAGEVKKKYDDRKIEKRIHALKREFINTIYNLDARVHFGVVTYNDSPFNWRPALVQANWANKLQCIQDIDQLSPAMGTNIWDGLENAFRFVADPKRPEIITFDNKGNYVTTVNGADTFFLMTDGNHNQGRFSGQGDFDEKAFLSEFKKINTLRRVVVNTIILGDTTLGSDNQDPIKQKSLSLFRQIAESSGGAFVHLGQ